MKKLFAVLLTLLLLLTALAPGQAQEDESNPLTTMMALIPDTPGIREWGFTYMDYRAITEARLGEMTPTSVEELYGEQEGGGTVDGIWRAALNGVVSGPSNLLQSVMMGMEEMPGAVGFDFFDIAQGVEFLPPPETVDILLGDFNLDAIASAFEARDYTANNRSGMTLWCGPDGCDTGNQVNLQNRNQANPFGGALGRNQPLLASDGMVISSTHLDNYQAILNGEVPTLADAPDFQAAARAILQSGQLIQAQFYGPSLFLGSDPITVLTPFLNSDMTDEERSAAIERMRQEIEIGGSVLPYYSVVVLADFVEGEAQVVRIGLVYTDADIAQMAVGVVHDRMLTYRSIVNEVPLADMLSDREASIEDPALYTDEVTGLTVALLTVRAPMPDNGLMDDMPMIQASSMVFRLFVNMVYQRDMGWLAVGEG